jgi:hypothetical protein
MAVSFCGPVGPALRASSGAITVVNRGTSTMTDSDEDYSFTVATDLGDKQILISKSALRILGGPTHLGAKATLAAYETGLAAIVVVRIEKGAPADAPIRLNGIDLSRLIRKI